MTCRRAQRQVEVPAEIVSPFETAGQSVVFSAPAPAAPEPVPAPVIPAPVRQTAPVPAAHIPAAPIPMRSTITSAPTPPPPAAAPFAAPTMLNTRPAPEPAAKPQLSYAAQPVAAKPAAPEPLTVGLTSVAEGWPESIRHEVVQLNLVDAKIGLPVDVVEQGLKQGKLTFSWKTVRSWVKNASPGASANDGLIIELPLKVVAPLFLARKKEATRDQQKVNVNTDIPNLFFGFPQSESALAGAVTKPVDTNYYVWDDTSETAHVNLEEVKRTSSPGTRFISKCATPNEVVSRAAAIEGVAGALVALPDGLMVASRLSPDLNGDTLAAFLPHIFGKVTQCTKELRMGELNNLSFTVGNVPWKIFRVNAIFFAAFGRAGEGLPGQQLAALAGELDHRNK
jgi:predicted regulator of Ras-like GTPase activity (Roadblock/LC7/MglB family)